MRPPRAAWDALTLEELLGFVVQSLDEIGIPYMLTGSLAASYHGAPRATQDVDLVIEADVSALAVVTYLSQPSQGVA